MRAISTGTSQGSHRSGSARAIGASSLRDSLLRLIGEGTPAGPCRRTSASPLLSNLHDLGPPNSAPLRGDDPADPAARIERRAMGFAETAPRLAELMTPTGRGTD